jgi:type IV secretory pathway VirB10-like protein
MKKWMYVIFPGILLVLFLFFYHQDMNAFQAREAAHAEAVAQQKKAEDDHRKAVELAAHEEAQKRAAEAAAEAAQKEKEKEDKWNAEGARIQKETDRFTGELDRMTKRASALEIERDSLNKSKEQESREDFELLKRIEQSRVDQHNAEMEIQRMVAMIAQRADDSAMAKMPPPPPPAKE